MEKTLAEESPKKITEEERQLIKARLASLAAESGGESSLMSFIQASPMKKDLLKFVNGIRNQSDPDLPELTTQ